MKNKSIQIRSRLRAGVIHFFVSLPFVLTAGLLVFGLWYPYPYWQISGGRELFAILLAVDIIIGPLVTMLVFNRAKPRRELVIDISIVALIQFAALGYGMWSVFSARPAYIVFEYTRFTVVHAVDVAPELLPKAPAALQQLPLTGPGLIALRPFKDAQEQLDATMAALNGAPLAARSDLWQPYAASVQAVLHVSRPLSELQARYPDESDRIQSVAEKHGHSAHTLRYLPMIGRKQAWTVLIDPVSAQPLGYLSIDSF